LAGNSKNHRLIMKTVLVCPLNWGIGHATRCVPVIRNFLENGFNVVIAADGHPLEFLRKEFPSVRILPFPGITITYPKNSRFVLKMFLLAPKFLYGIFREHRILKKLLKKENVDIILSDNRYGLWNKDKYTILMTHQLDIHLPGNIRFLAGFVRKINLSLIRKFDECWVPDFELHQGLAGKLSHPPLLPSNAIYIGALSRFSSGISSDHQAIPIQYDFIAVLSGPEPQRSIFENIILSQLKSTNLKGFVIRGMIGSDQSYNLTENIRVVSHLETRQLKTAMLGSEVIICRPGYSSIMDIVTLGKRAIFIPTPGQTEQEYLARYLMDKKIFFSMKQSGFDLLYAFEMSQNWHGLVMQNDYQILEERIRFLRAFS
jgi:uncharacterized protein (TIGR00661 family)